MNARPLALLRVKVTSRGLILEFRDQKTQDAHEMNLGIPRKSLAYYKRVFGAEGVFALTPHCSAKEFTDSPQWDDEMASQVDSVFKPTAKPAAKRAPKRGRRKST